MRLLLIHNLHTGLEPQPEVHNPRPLATSLSPSKRPRRELGMMVSGGGYIVPDAIRDKFAKWEVHIPLTYLTDNFCSSQQATQSSLSDFLAVIDGQLTTKSKSLSPVGELDMSFDEWHQAWQRLLKLIAQYHADELPFWQTHYSSIMVKETRGEDWPLWLAYDTEVRRRSVTTGLDPSKFQQRLFDDLYVRHTGKRILSQLQSASAIGTPPQNSPSSSRFHPYQRLPDNGYTNRSRGDSFCSTNSNSKTSTSRCQYFSVPPPFL